MNEAPEQHWDKRAVTYWEEQNRAESFRCILDDPQCAFPKKVMEMLEAEFRTLSGVKVLVPSSGDNLAVFALHLLGADVMSTDLSQKQLDNAENIAKENGWRINFIKADSKALTGLPENEFDLVFTSYGVGYWIDDLVAMYSSINRVLKKNGVYCFFENQPIKNIFAGTKDKGLTILQSYDIDFSMDNPFHFWKIENYIRSLLKSGFIITDYRDIHRDKDAIPDLAVKNRSFAQRKERDYKEYDWRKNMWAALPAWFGICAKKST